MISENVSVENGQNTDESAFLYEKTILCPVCESKSKNLAVKKGSYRIINKESDLMIQYSGINPTYYEIKFCSECGYTALPSYFDNVKEKEKMLIKEKITKKWVKPHYPNFYDIDFAIKQLQLALLNSLAKQGQASEKGLICLKLSWLYRIKSDESNEKRFQLQASNCFEEAYMRETFPVAGLDEWTLLYLVGELYRRLGNFDKALSYFSQVLVSNQATSKLKDMVREQKNLI